MAADMAAARQMLVRMGLTNEAATVVVAADGQGLVTIDDFAQLNEKSVEGVCRSLRRPGGQTNGVVNRGVSVSAMAESNLQGMIYYIKHFKRVSRTCTYAQVLLPNVRALYHQRDTEKAHKDPEVVPTVDPNDWPKTLETTIEYIHGFRGVDGHPLSYVFNKEMVPPPEADDPAYREPGSTYFTPDEEMLARAPMLSGPAVAGTDPEVVGPFNPSFITDRASVWDKMGSIFSGSPAWTHMKAAKKHRNGRLAERLIYDHYLGPSNIDHMASSCERKLAGASYRGETRGWSFEKFATLHQEQHNIIEGLMEHGYTGIDERSKVRYLSDGIKTSTLDSVKTRIMSDAALRQDFSACVTLYKDFVKQDTLNKKQELGIASMGTDLDKKVSFATKLEDRFYLPEEWKDLPDSDKDAVRKMRAARKGKAGYAWQKGKGKDAKFKSKVAKLEKKIKHQKRQLAAFNTASKDDGSDDDSSGGTADGATSNRGHSALTRQSGKRSKK